MERLRQSKKAQVSEALERLGLSVPIEYLLNSDLRPKSLIDENHYDAARAAVLCKLERRSEGPDWRIIVPEIWRFLVGGSEEIVVSKYSWQGWEKRARRFLEEL